MSMIHKFLDQVQFKSHEDFMEHFHVNVPEHFNFAYDVIDAYAATWPRTSTPSASAGATA